MIHSPLPPLVRLVGDIEHPDFTDVEVLLRSESRLETEKRGQPELIIIAQSRPGMISFAEVDAHRRSAPLAGVIALLGSWCEGELRTGRPWPGVGRLYWYEFPAWWRRQLRRRAAGHCPDWARPSGQSSPLSRESDQSRHYPAQRDRGLVVVRSAVDDTCRVMADVLVSAGYSTVTDLPRRPTPQVGGIAAGVWVGGQLDPEDVADFCRFCRSRAFAVPPVLALLDFPRRDEVKRARELGIVAVLGKPWLNVNLLETLSDAIQQSRLIRAA